MNPDSLKALTDLVLRHRDQRDWAQFHNPKELAISLSVEASELLSLMQWKTGEQLTDTLRSRSGDLRDELADVLHWRFSWPRIWKSISAPRSRRRSSRTPPNIPWKRCAGKTSSTTSYNYKPRWRDLTPPRASPARESALPGSPSRD